MTRKEMITKCVDWQIANGIAKAESRTKQIKARLNGTGHIKAMNKAECEKWYYAVFTR